ncbi:immunity 26/phosphotriesterase HocA family protein [Acetivibrio mesophilus]|uniref:Uncharacterized protein n=1 Tax=Acetivibrio mesophilus TaxID=2487273 RepID=A0A4Q0I9D5_9FIRM|nr:immunity 26/phosphotriesterase HocA family protein [Acetivibrio mesophilus]RXE60667.1 hypothetical protein EFD62_01740 [Acetivibrio mesophilus]HHV28079.1 hypothetical protein [Clostridium sp.]
MKILLPTNMNEKALKLLKKYYHGHEFSNKSYGQYSTEDFEYCKTHGVMFENLAISHHGIISEIKKIIADINIDNVVTGFLYSLSSGDKQYRTALASYVYAKSLPDHSYEPEKNYCRVCGFRGGEGADDNTIVTIDLNEYSYMRFFGGTQDLGDIAYVLHDLKEFLKLPKVNFNEKDIFILNRIFGLATRIGTGNRVIALQKLITKEKVFQASKTEIDTILGILSMCGVFQTEQDKGYIYEYTNSSDRGFEHECDLYYPLNWWRGKHGVNYSAVKEIFGPCTGNMLTEDKMIAFDDASIKGQEERIKTTRKIKAQKYFEEDKYLIEFNHGERPYFALDEIDPSWEKVTMFSTTYNIHKRTVFFFDKDIIRKIIYEEIVDDNGKEGIVRDSYSELNTEIVTKNRNTILPKTERGREKSLTPTNAMNGGFTECHFNITFANDNYPCHMYCANARNVQYLHFLGHENIRNNNDFRKYVEEYVSNSPKNHMERIKRIRNSKHVTVKFTAGDIFRVEFDYRHYGYGIILGKIRQLEKWDEIPKEHVFRRQMTQPIIFRMYDIVTEDGNLKKEDLQNIELLPLDIAQDNEIIWGTYPIIDTKTLEEKDIDLPFMIEPLKGSKKDKVKITWGTSIIELDAEKIPELLKYRTDFYGVSLCMNFDYLLSKHGYRSDSYTDLSKYIHIAELKRKLAEYLGEDENFDMDDFAKRFGGLTRKQYIELAYERFKK